ncbi:MAG: hypothetical protein RL247_552, partial [Actinomycetota bacterium]
ETVSPEVAAEVADITARAMKGELDFETSLRTRVRALEGVPLEAIEKANHRVELTPGAKELVDTLHSLGHLVGAVSGGFHHMVDPLAQELGLDFHRANNFGVESGLLNGEVLEPFIDAQAKEQTLRDWAQAFGIDMRHTVAVGDGGNDVMMIRAAGVGIAFMAKPVVKSVADVVIDSPDLSLVLDALNLRP